ncbi:MAG: carboxypeptidase-like regulatory domain-containing protein [Bacteroidota bacterium]
MPNRPKPNFPGTQNEEYAVSKLMYDRLEITEIHDAFEAKKPGKYTSGFILSLRDNRTTAMNLPDDEQRSAIHETLRIQLVGLNFNCCENFQDLKGYIHDGFPKNEWQVKYKEAGLHDYTPASHGNWVSTNDLNSKMKTFISTYATQLANGYMPTAFATKVTTDAAAFTVKYDAFESSKGTGVGTSAKVIANNVVYEDMQNLQNDAHMVFRNDAAKLKLFTIMEVKKQISPPGSANLGLELIEKGSNLPIENASITIQSATGVAKHATTNAQGEADFSNIDPDVYHVKIQITGKPDMNLTKEVDTGVSARMKLVIP